jgi:hypothetical protein
MLKRRLILGDFKLMGSDAEVERELIGLEEELKAAAVDEALELEDEAYRRKMALRSNKRIMKF